MVKICCVCNLDYQSVLWYDQYQTITFHKFPKNESVRDQWIHFVRIRTGDYTWTPRCNSLICGQHFSNDDYMKAGANERERVFLRRGIIPTLDVAPITWDPEYYVDEPVYKTSTTNICLQADSESIANMSNIQEIHEDQEVPIHVVDEHIEITNGRSSKPIETTSKFPGKHVLIPNEDKTVIIEVLPIEDDIDQVEVLRISDAEIAELTSEPESTPKRRLHDPEFDDVYHKYIEDDIQTSEIDVPNSCARNMNLSRASNQNKKLKTLQPKSIDTFQQPTINFKRADYLNEFISHLQKNNSI